MKSFTWHGFALTLAVAWLMSGTASAETAQTAPEEWNLGIGGLFDCNLGGGYTLKNEDTATTVSRSIAAPYYGGGVELIFASKYAEATIGVILAEGIWARERATHWKTADETRKDTLEWVKDTMFTVGFNLGLWLKYPYYLSSATSNSSKVFPIFGIDYEICFSAKIKKDTLRIIQGDNIERIKEKDYLDLSRFWFKLGVGADFSLSENVYLHPVILYGVGLKNNFEKNVLNKTTVKDDDTISGETKLSHGLTIKIGICYRYELN
jgi:hypothetical protein